jgi:hypothetical protein
MLYEAFYITKHFTKMRTLITKRESSFKYILKKQVAGISVILVSLKHRQTF